MLIWLIVAPLLAGFGLPWWLERYSRGLSVALTLLISMGCFLGLLALAPEVAQGQVVLEHWHWLPELGLNLSLRLDGLGLIFGLLICGIGILVYGYAWFYLSAKNSIGKLYSALLLFMAAMLGVVLSNNLLLLLTFWELTSISSFLLVGYWQRYGAAQQGAQMALIITGMGGLALLGGFILLGHIAGTFELDQLLGMAPAIQQHAYFLPAMGLILLGAFTKSAQFPLHFWLPQAMAAPTPVSAYLHSATMVKAGIFLLARLFPILAGAWWFHAMVTGIGLLTLCFAAFIAMFKHDLKALLAYSTISHLGLIVCLLGIGTPLAVAAAIFHVINHALFKAALFMIAGIIDHETGTRDLRKLGGLWLALPWTGTLAMIAAAAMAGVPLTNGFLSKEMFFAETLPVATDAVSQVWLGLLPVLATLAGVFAVTYSWRLVHNTFFNRSALKPGLSAKIPNQQAHEPSLGMRLPVLLLCLACLLIGILPAPVIEPVVQLGRDAIVGKSVANGAAPVHITLWHGFNWPLVMSGLALLGGTLLYYLLIRNNRLLGYNSAEWFGPWSGDAIFKGMMTHGIAAARQVIAYIENGSLQRYLMWIVLTTLVFAVFPLWGKQLDQGDRLLTLALWPAIVLWLLLLTSCLMLLYFHHERIKAVLLLGAVGLVTALAFVGLSAPDLALTQISIDVVSTVLLLMSLSLLPQLTPYESSKTRHWKDMALSLAGGAGIGWLAWLVLTRDHQSIAWFFIQEALPQGGGSNVVNVILVDFRGFDTFGEICVLGIAALGALVMMDGMRAHGAIATKGLTRRFVPSPLMLRMTASWILPIALLYSLYILLRGHNLPGGGFIAGVITAIAFIIQYIAMGQTKAEQLIHARHGRLYEYWIGGGLTLAGLTGMGALLWQQPWLTSAYFYIELAWLGKVPVASAMLFDIGVYFTVTGAVLLLICVLGDSRQSRLPASRAASKGKRHAG